MENGHKGRRFAASAAVRRYPQFELAIYRLLDADEVFRDICEELAEADLALSKVGTLPTELRETRRAEWEELVERLAGELLAVFESSDVFRRSSVDSRRPR